MKFTTQTAGTLLLAALLLFAFSAQLSAQQMLKIEGGEVFMLQELGGVILEKDGKIKILMVMPPEKRMANYKEVDLQKDDEIIMFNGKKVKSVKFIEEAYNNSEVGASLKFGIKRNGEMRIISLDKADPEDLPKLKMITETVGDGGGKKIEGGMKIMKAPEGLDDFSELEMLEGSGIVAGEKEGEFQIASLMPHVNETIGEGKLMAGDVIVKFNGNEFKTLRDLAKMYHEVESGKSVTFELLRDGKPVTVTFDKPENNTDMIIEKK